MSDRTIAVSLLISCYIMILEMVEKGLNDYCNDTEYGWKPESLRAMRMISEAQSELRKCITHEERDNQ